VDHKNALPGGYRLQQYELRSILGHGGFGITYLATDIDLGHQVAIKEYLPQELVVREGGETIAPKSAADEDSFLWGLDRFREEARLLARFKHPNIVRVLNFLEANGTGYMVMDYEEGQTLTEFLQSQTVPAAEAQLLSIFLPIMDGLREVHAAGLMHRDIKPGNIYLRSNGSPMLIDFGAARAALGERSKSLSVLVTQGYAPVEQYSSRSHQGPWTDVYALGATLHRCISGEVPLESSARLTSVVENSPDPLPSAMVIGKGRYSDNLLKAIDWSLQIRAQDRPQSIIEFQRALTGDIPVPVLGGSFDRNTGTYRGSSTPLMQDKRLRVAIWTALSLIALVALGGLVAGGYWGFDKWETKRNERDRAAFAKAQQAGTPEAFKTYAETCTTCGDRDQALALADDAAYQTALDQGTPEALGQYLTICQQCRHRAEAEALKLQKEEEQRLAAIEKERDQAAIQRVKGPGSVRRVVLVPAGYASACLGTIRSELSKIGIQNVPSEEDYDATMTVSISTPVFFNNGWAAGYKTRYSAQLKRRGDNKALWSTGDSELGTSALNACTDSAEEVAEALEDVR
jgi:serine/threonine protein kinase